MNLVHAPETLTWPGANIATDAIRRRGGPSAYR